MASLLIVALVKGVLRWMVYRGGESFDYFYVIVHVEPSLGDIIHILASLLSFAILSFCDDFARVEILSLRLILGVIPGYITVGIVQVHGSGRHHYFWVIHD